MFKTSLDTLKPYTPEVPTAVLAQQLGRAEVTRLSANENVFGTSPAVKQAVCHWDFANACQYPDGNANELRQAVARFQNVQPAQLLFGCGLDEVIELIARTFLEPGDEVLEPWPTFSEYKLHAIIENAKVIDTPIQPDSGQFDLAKMLTKITANTKLIWLCNPNNPTGTFIPLADLARFLDQVPKNTLVLIDEAYIEFVTQAKPLSAITLLDQYPNIIVMRTFSKIYGLANFRVGYAVMSQALTPKLQAVRLPYNLNGLAQVAAIAALADQDFIDQTRQKIQQERTRWLDFLAEQDLKYYPSQTNFVFFETPKAAAIKQTLLENGYLIRDGLQPNWLRITIGTPEQNKEIQKIIKSVSYSG